MDATDDDASKCRSTLATFFDGDRLTREDVREVYGECRLRSSGVICGVALFVVWTSRGEAGDEPHLIAARKAVADTGRSMMLNKIFVYGTLLRSLERAHWLARAQLLGVARVRGRLHDLGSYPGLMEGSGWVLGELYAIDAETGRDLDRVEGFDPSDEVGSLYRRVPTQVQLIATGETVTAETYVYNQAVPAGSSIEHGDYRRSRLEANGAERVWVIAYGSNMHTDRLTDRIGSYRESRAGFVDHARLTFNKGASSGGVYANLARGTREDRCPIVAARLTPQQVLSLDRYEGTPSHYLRTVIPFQDRQTEAVTLGYVYLAAPEQLVEASVPNWDYLRHLARGYEEHGFETETLPRVQRREI